MATSVEDLRLLVQSLENEARAKDEILAARESPWSILRTLVARVGAQRVHDALTPAQRLALKYFWPVWARPSIQIGPREYRGQILPAGTWRNALLLAGRGFGKSRTGTEWARDKAERMPGSRGALIGKTAPEVRKILGFGASGIAGVCPPWNLPRWSTLDQCFEWPNGSIAFLFSGDAPDSLRGHEFDWAVFDEAAAVRYLATVWSNLQLALRRGTHPQCLITTTPRPLKWLRTLMAQDDTVILRGTTFDNAANLPRSFLDSVATQFGGSGLGRQELLGEVLDEAEGAIWRRKWIDDFRVKETPQLVRVAVGLDPSASSLEEHDECGIVAVGLGIDGHLYLLEDASMVGSPEEWGRRAVQCFHDNEADLIVVENTRGGAMCQTVIKLIDRNVKVTNRGAGASKRTRAEPIAAIAEQGRLHHVGDFDDLENELTGWIPPEVTVKAQGGGDGSDKKIRSPNRMDALVYAGAELALKPAIPSQRGLNARGKSTRRI